VVTAKRGDLTVTSGDDSLATYRFNTRQAEHHFCVKCGIYTHHRRRSNLDLFSVNVACLSGVSPFDFAEVPVYDGITHPGDRPHRPGYEVAGTLFYVARNLGK
jgi:hypothetical protein